MHRIDIRWSIFCSSKASKLPLEHTRPVLQRFPLLEHVKLFIGNPNFGYFINTSIKIIKYQYIFQISTTSKTSTPVLLSPQVETPKPIPDKPARVQQIDLSSPVVEKSANAIQKPIPVTEAPVAPTVPVASLQAAPEDTVTFESFTIDTPTVVESTTIVTTTVTTENQPSESTPVDIPADVAVQQTKTVEIRTERSATPEQATSVPIEENGTDVNQGSDDRPFDNSEMTASMIQRRVITEDEAKAALAERRRLARVEAERQAEVERQRIEAEEAAEIQRQEEEEERQRLLEEETLRLVEEQRKAEEQRLLQAIEVRFEMAR